MNRILLILLFLIFLSCGRLDNFHEVTKEVFIQDSIIVDEPFKFRLLLKNENENELKLTIDKNVQQSVFFRMFFYCNGELISTKVDNPNPVNHDYNVHFLKTGDSLVYDLNAVLQTISSDSLALRIEGYDRIYKLRKSSCNETELNFGGMWIPGHFNPADAMEGYNFNKRVIIVENN